MKNTFTKTAAVIFIASLSLAACSEKKEPTTGEKVDSAVQTSKEKMESANEKSKEAFEDAKAEASDAYADAKEEAADAYDDACLLYTSPSPRDS